MPTVSAGDSVTVSADAVNARPKWLKWTATGQMGGTAKLPSGHRRLVTVTGTARTETDYYVTPPTLTASTAKWRATIYASNGSEIYADGLKGFPTIGTPTVRLGRDAPAKAILTIPADRNGGLLSPSFDGWSDGHTEAVGRGMELTVEYRRPDGTMDLVFRGMIYQITGGSETTITAYDRLMDLAQFSDQMQGAQGYVNESIPVARTTGSAYEYDASSPVGTLISASTSSIIDIDSSHHADSAFGYGSGQANGWGWVIQGLPSKAGVTTTGRIDYVRITTGAYGAPLGLCVALLHRTAPNTMQVMDITEVKTSASQTTFTWGVAWSIPGASSEYYLALGFKLDGDGSGDGVKSLTQHYTNSDYYIYNGSLSQSDVISVTSWPWGSNYPELAVQFTTTYAIPVNSVSISGQTIAVPSTEILAPTQQDCVTTISAGVRLQAQYISTQSTTIKYLVEELVEGAGLVPDIPAGANMGSTNYYQSSVYDYLTLIQELVSAGNFGIRASVTEPGKAEVRPRHTIDDTPVASFTTDPDGSGERSITDHSLTQHWMAEKATQAILAENATSSGLPLAIETDDRLLDGSLAEELQSPLRGITADSSMGTHDLMAMSAGGQMIQLHTNIVEGEIVLAGYRSDLWYFSGSYADGKPISITVPDCGITAVAIPTQMEFGGGATKITLDNIRTADRSEIARSMGLTSDALSNTVGVLPSTAYLFARYEDYAAQETGITAGSVTSVSFYQEDGTLAAMQTDGTYIKTVTDVAGYLHVCTVMPGTLAGYATSSPITTVRFVMGGTTRTAVLDNPKFALGGQAIHCDIRFRHA